MTSQLQTKITKGQFVLTAEVVPPMSTRPEKLLEVVNPLVGLADAANVTDGAGARAHLECVVAAHFMKQAGLEPILQLTGRDRNRIALQSSLVGAAALGLYNVMFLTGDDPKQGDQPDAKPVFDLDSSGLLRTAASIRDKGELPHGQKVDGAAPFFIGASDVPVDPPADWQPTSLIKKLDAGAQFAQTQFCMDAGIVRRYIQRLGDLGVLDRVSILIGVAPLASAKSARWINGNLFGSIIPESIIDRLEKAEKPKAEGRRICVEFLQELAEIKGVGGAHVMAPLNESALPAVLAEAREKLKLS